MEQFLAKFVQGMHVYPLSFFFVMDFIGTLSMAFEPWAAERTLRDVGSCGREPTCVQPVASMLVQSTVIRRSPSCLATRQA